jgi:CheY-like chemotaxis protein/phosphoribosyl 1,2-cyclic phosphodiesterase
MRVRFWGTRGSIPKPGPTTLRYGGNTSCVETRAADGTLVVLDCGTGAHGLGQALLASGEKPLRGHLLIGHTHWDHIQGFPFFTPLFVPGNEWDIYAPGALGRSLEDTLAGQMEYTYFPVTLEQLGATIRYHNLIEGSFAVGGVRVTAQYLNHPALSLGYRLEAGGVSIVYSTDHEPHGRSQPDAPDGSGPSYAAPVHREDRRHVAFLAGADLVIHDAQYTIAEYASKVGWGHTTAEWAVDFAAAAGAKRLALFHHEPLRDDDSLERLLEVCRARAAAQGSGLEVLAAAEGLTLDFPERAVYAAAPGEEATATLTGAVVAAAAETVLIVDDDLDIVDVLKMALRSEGVRLVAAHDGDSALRLAGEEHPALILVDWQLPDRDGLEVCRAIRAASDPALKRVPVVMLTAQSAAEDAAAGFAAGATDYLTKPFSTAHLRSRVRGWLQRSRAQPA